jgi:hypothetical protein
MGVALFPQLLSTCLQLPGSSLSSCLRLTISTLLTLCCSMLLLLWVLLLLFFLLWFLTVSSQCRGTVIFSSLAQSSGLKIENDVSQLFYNSAGLQLNSDCRFLKWTMTFSSFL